MNNTKEIYKNKRIVFFGTPDFTVPFLELFRSLGLDIVYIVTGEDKPVGRGQFMHPPAPMLWTLPEGNMSGPAKLDFPKVLQPRKLDEEFCNFLISEHEENNFDIFIVVAYGKIIPEKIINLPNLGTINLHYSLLPKYRGASPVETAILNGDKKTGITIQHMVYKLDAGNILFQEETEIDINETTSMLRDRMNKRALEIFPEFLKELFEPHRRSSLTLTDPTLKVGGIQQDEELATKCGKFEKKDFDVTEDLKNKDLEMVYRKYKAFDKKIFFFYNWRGTGPMRVKIKDMSYTASTGVYEIRKLLPESRKEITLKDFENSFGKIFEK